MNYDRNIVAFDNDGVTHDFAAGVWEFLTLIGKVTGPMPTVTNWHFYREPAWGSMSDKTFVQTCHDGVDAGIIFNHGDPHPETVEAMNDLYEDGHRIVIVTDRSFGSQQGLQSRRSTYEWLRRHGFRFHEVHFTADKTTVPFDFIVDDKTENFVDLTAVGRECYLLDQPWNQHCDAGDKRISSIREYVDIVRDKTRIKNARTKSK